MSDIRIDDDGFLMGDAEQERTEAENVLMREIKADTTTIISLMKGTQRLQRDALKSAQSTAKAANNRSSGTGNNNGSSGQGGNSSGRVNLVHPNRANSTTSTAVSRGQSANNTNVQAVNTARPNTLQNQASSTGSTSQQSPTNNGQPAQRINRQRGANGRFVGEGQTDESAGETAQGRGNRDARGRFTGRGNNAEERSALSRMTDTLKDLDRNISINANTDRIDPMIDAMKEVGDIASVGIDAGKKALSVSNTLVAKPAMALGRGIKGLFKPKTDAINSPVAWYKRIWRTLVQGNRQDQTQHNQEQRRLDELVRGQGQRGSADGSLLMMLALGLGALLGLMRKFTLGMGNLIPDFLKSKNNESPINVGRLPTTSNRVQTYPPTRAQAMAERLKASPVGRAASWLSETKIGQATGRLLRKLPYISSALELGAGGINAANIATDEHLTEAEKSRLQSINAGRTGGAIAGGLGGATAGAIAGSVVPVVGTIVGAVVGGWLGTEGGRLVGDKIGGWADDLRKADIAGRISNAWSGFLTPLQPIFNRINDTAMSVFNAVGKTWSDFVADTKMRFGGIVAGLQAVADFFANVGDTWNTWIKKATGIDVRENLKQSKNAVNDWVGQKLDNANQFASDVGQSIKNTPLVQSAMGIFNGLAGETETEKQARLRNFNEANYKKYQPLLDSVYQQKGFSTQAQAFLKAQVQAESGFNPNAVSKKGAFGLTQFMPATAKQYGVDKNNVQSQVEGQAKYMGYLLKHFGGDWDKALAGYNWGEGNVRKVIATANKTGADWRTLLPQETKDYLVKIKRNALNYGALTASQIAQQAPSTMPSPPTAKLNTSTVPSLKSAPVSSTPTPNVQSIQQVQAKESPTRLNNTPTPIKVSIAKPLAGQNVSDRSIAHIVTGGIGEVV